MTHRKDIQAMQRTEIEGVEVYRTLYMACDHKEFTLTAKAVAACGHIPVVQIEGDATVLYAIRPGLIRKAKK